MEKNKKSMSINRIVSFALGGLLVFAVMSFTVVRNANTKSEELAQALDTSRFEAGRLLDDANAQLLSGDYVEAEASLTALFANQPGSPEAIEGKILLAKVEKEAMAADQRWEAALPAIRADWADAETAKLQAKFDKDQAKFESELEATVNTAWEKELPKIRVQWTEDQQL